MLLADVETSGFGKEKFDCVWSKRGSTVSQLGWSVGGASEGE
jgi:hypothetical protein